jgi:quinol-cytochrome oxidoreductase complex cytochrome b subunit
MDKEIVPGETSLKTNSNSHFFIPALWGTFALTLFSGILMMVYYIPTFAQAFSSVERMNEQVPFGWVIRRAHSVGGNSLLILMLLYLLDIFYRGEYKSGSRAGWVLAILSFFLTVWTNLSGFFLPLSQSAFWGTVAVLSSLSSIPGIGSFSADFLRGGKELGGTALVRLYSMHVGFSALIGLLLFWTHRLSLSEKKKEEESDSQRRNGILFAAAGLLLTVVTFAPDWFSDPLKEAANPMLNPQRVSPPWYFLFLEETLRFIAVPYPAWSAVAIILIPLLLILLPYIDRNPERSILLRPLALGLGAAFLVAVVYFSLLGTANARYGEKIILPDSPLSASEIRGARVFAEKNCAYCHQVFGKEGRREGPDMAVVKQRLRSPLWIQRFILNARLYRPGTTMPRYEIPLEDLEALSAYLLSLDSRKGNFKAVDRRQFLDYGPYLEVQKDEKR